MNVLAIFEQRIGAIFDQGAPGERLPFSFKRLARRAVREMEDETFVIDGVDTAPALYTILVSTRDDTLMRPLYVQITNEISQLIEAQAKKRGYTFVGKPLVRFMVDPALRGGKFWVFAENIDPRTLARLRDEENAYLGITTPQEIYVEHGFVPNPVPVHDDEPAPIAQEVAFSGDNLTEEDAAPADIMVEEPISVEEAPEEEASDIVEDSQEVASEDSMETASPETKEEVPGEVASEPVSEGFVAPFFATTDEEPAQEALPTQEEEAAAPVKDVCTLTDLETFQSYQVHAPEAIIGRERIPGGVVVHDPNASRRHARLSFDGTDWYIVDLNSTNGTLVNDVDLPECTLHDGDVLTIGLTNLEFRIGII